MLVDTGLKSSRDPPPELVALMESLSFRLQLKTFPRLFNGFSMTDGIWCSPRLKWNLSMTFPFFRTIFPLPGRFQLMPFLTDSLGPSKAMALPAFHASTGCHTALFGKGKKTVCVAVHA